MNNYEIHVQVVAKFFDRTLKTLNKSRNIILYVTYVGIST